MKTLRRKKTRRERLAALLGDYLKVKAATKAAKGVGRRAPVKPLAIAGAIGAAGIVAKRKRGTGSPAAA